MYVCMHACMYVRTQVNHFLTAAPCGAAFIHVQGDVAGTGSACGQSNGESLPNGAGCEWCATKCSGCSACQSYECSLTEKKCNLNEAAEPTATVNHLDYAFCKKGMFDAYVCMFVFVCTCIYVCMFVCTYVRMYVCTYICANVCTYDIFSQIKVSRRPPKDTAAIGVIRQQLLVATMTCQTPRRAA